MKRLQVSLRLSRRTALLVGAADDAKVAKIALPLVRCRREKGLGDRVADRLGDLTGRRSRLVIKEDNLLSETAGRRAEIELSG